MEKSCKKGDNVIVKIHYSAISTACMRWVYYDRPCDLQIKRSTKNDEFIGICFKVENEASVYFFKRNIKRYTRFRVLYKL